MDTAQGIQITGIGEYFLSELLGTKVFQHEKKLGKLADVVVVEREQVAEVTHVLIHRPFGDPTMVIPWDGVTSVSAQRIEIEVASPEQYVRQPQEGEILLNDHILDKKVLDTAGKEVEIVYDVKLSLRNGRCYVVGVDLSRSGLLRRIGLRGLARTLGLAKKGPEQLIAWTYIRPLPTNLGSFKGTINLTILKEELAEMHPVDLADVLETMDSQQRVALFEGLEPEHASDTLEEIDPNVQRDLILSLRKDKVADLLNEMTPGQAADVLSVLPADAREELITLLAADNVAKIQAILEQQDQKIVNYATTDILTFSPDQRVGEVQDGYRTLARGKDVITYLYVVDAADRLVGVTDLKKLLQANDEDRLKDIMIEAVISLKPNETLKKASDLFLRYGFGAIPITDDDGRILGAVTYRDILHLKHRLLD
ncbi:MAG TPA: CBS domain-containing protein [Methylomirabilota bacterium]|nr:CBS domain-containing protein [Methylomirabilota bacterium]